MRRAGGVLAVWGALAAGMIARAQEQAPQPAAPPPASAPEVKPPIDPMELAPKWTLRFEPAAWYVAPGGKLQLPSSGGGQKIRVENLDLDNPRLSPFVAGDIRVD